MRTNALVRDLYAAMLARLGPSRWWPGDTPFEVAVGAVLTQNTNWTNVEKAIGNLNESGVLEPHALAALPDGDLAELIRPAGYFRVKTKRLKHLLRFLLDEADGDMQALAERPLEELRPALLGVNGIGPETADSILLYALNKPTFVVDAYTARIGHRHGLCPEDVSYDELKDLFETALEPDVPSYNEYHALLVRVGKHWCRKSRPKCTDCPLAPYLDA